MRLCTSPATFFSGASLCLFCLQILAVTNVRASPDYHPGGSFSTDPDYPPNWALGFPSILHFAMGVYPSKDSFWTTPVQVWTVANGSSQMSS